jgi:hypothetical protein
MQNRENANRSSHVAGITGQLGEGCGGGIQENPQELYLMGSHDLMEFPGEREDEVNVRYRQEFLPPRREPSLRIRTMTLRAAAIAAGVIRVVDCAALIALKDMPPERFGAATSDIRERSPVRRQHAIAEAPEILRPVLPEDLRQHGL